jgi:hypothetical protein
MEADILFNQLQICDEIEALSDQYPAATPTPNPPPTTTAPVPVVMVADDTITSVPPIFRHNVQPPRDLAEARIRAAQKLYPIAWSKPRTRDSNEGVIEAGALILMDPTKFAAAHYLDQATFMQQSRAAEEVSRKERKLKPKRKRDRKTMEEKAKKDLEIAVAKEKKFTSEDVRMSDVSSLNSKELKKLIPVVQDTLKEQETRREAFVAAIRKLGNAEMTSAGEEQRKHLLAGRNDAQSRIQNLRIIIPAMEKRLAALRTAQEADNFRNARKRALEIAAEAGTTAGGPVLEEESTGDEQPEAEEGPHADELELTGENGDGPAQSVSV